MRSSLLTMTVILVSPLPLTTGQTATSQQPGTETGLVVTPLPWPHSTNGAVRSTAIASDTTSPQENFTTTAAPMESNQCKDFVISVVIPLLLLFVVVSQALNTINWNDILTLVIDTANQPRSQGLLSYCSPERAISPRSLQGAVR